MGEEGRAPDATMSSAPLSPPAEHCNPCRLHPLLPARVGARVRLLDCAAIAPPARPRVSSPAPDGDVDRKATRHANSWM
eukprot:7918469-Pyramimonas_sp.AAC.1